MAAEGDVDPTRLQVTVSISPWPTDGVHYLCESSDLNWGRTASVARRRRQCRVLPDSRTKDSSANPHRIPALGETMPGASPRLGSRLYSWPVVAVALLVAQAALSLTLKQGPTLVAFCEITYLLLLLMASGVAAVNAVQSRQTVRLFWSFLAGAFGLWALVPCSWFYSVVLHGKIPTFLFDNPPLFLHIVLMMAAVASRPHLRLLTQRPYRTTFNFLVLLFVWVFAYAYLLFPYQCGSQASAMILRFEGLYFTENLLLLGVLSNGDLSIPASLEVHLLAPIRGVCPLCVRFTGGKRRLGLEGPFRRFDGNLVPRRKRFNRNGFHSCHLLVRMDRPTGPETSTAAGADRSIGHHGHDVQLCFGYARRACGPDCRRLGTVPYG